MATTITALFNNHIDAEKAVSELQNAGILRKNISLLVSEDTHRKHFTIDEASKVPEGIATGGVAGGILGALAAGLVAIGSIAVPGAGFLASGPLVAAITGGGAGALTGGLVGGLIGLGIPEHEAKLYEKELKGGSILIAVAAQNDVEVEAARHILKSNDATSIAA